MSDLIAFQKFQIRLPAYLQQFAVNRWFPLEIDLYDAIDWKLYPAGHFMFMHQNVHSISTTWESMCMTPPSRVLWNRLRELGVPLELREMIRDYWIVENSEPVLDLF